ncbi:uncharacterized protein LOC124273890 [Haliotis rubra]|uniref:uncharacterized protein LOC124273890 n=1 Tax=Haliotis rubra TaxID=36100 RepID=UPI001EE59E37|nr:uncharacterized protein LOC124273890 [Haliotis rubra]
MFLKFKSDSSGVDDGFKMTYSSEINHKSSGSNIGVIIGGSIGGAFFLLLVIIVICINTNKLGQRTAANAVPVQYQVALVPLVNNSGQAPITNALPPTTFTGPPTDTTQGPALPSSGYVNAEALPKKI